jgi:hypothetical protein
LWNQAQEILPRAIARQDLQLFGQAKAEPRFAVDEGGKSGHVLKGLERHREPVRDGPDRPFRGLKFEVGLGLLRCARITA